MAIFLGIFAFQIHSKPQTRSAAHTNQQIHRMQTWHRIGKGCTQGRKKAEELFRHVCALGNSPRFSQIGTYKTGNEVRQVQEQLLLCLITHRSRS
jgi:bacterioferritin (cytochrome b1)